MILTGAVRINSRTPEVKAQGQGFAMEFVEILGEESVKAARANVLPGIGPQGIGGSGPGPHPHRSLHWDTGKLRDSIKYRIRQQGFIFVSQIETDVSYGLYLEMGWTAASGRHYRYPWLYPAVVMVANRWEPIARATTDRWFGNSWRTVQKINTPLSSTLFGE